MYKIKRLFSSKIKEEQQREFTTKSGKKMILPDIDKLVKESMKEHKEAYDILAR